MKEFDGYVDWVVFGGATFSEEFGSLADAQEQQGYWPGSVIYKRTWQAEAAEESPSVDAPEIP